MFKNISVAFLYAVLGFAVVASANPWNAPAPTYTTVYSTLTVTSTATVTKTATTTATATVTATTTYTATVTATTTATATVTSVSTTTATVTATSTTTALATTTATTTTTTTVTPPAPTQTTISQCNTGSIQCCNSVQDSSSTIVTSLAGLLGISLGSITGLVGVTCSPLSVIGVGSNSCSQQPVCCENNSFNGILALGCNSINL